MTLEQFIFDYDKELSIVLLEGKREVLEEDKPKLIRFGKKRSNENIKIYDDEDCEGIQIWYGELDSEKILEVYEIFKEKLLKDFLKNLK